MLLIDAGNTRIKWALSAPGADAGDWRAEGVLAHADIAQLSAACQATQAPRALISNVAGQAVQRAVSQSLIDGGLAADQIDWFSAQAQCAGISNTYRDPTQLGCDRFAALIGARQLRPTQALLVVSCGTATTLDALSAEGEFMGGMILPGLAAMKQALASAAAQLPQVGWIEGQLAFADNTEQGIANGCLTAQVASILQAWQAMRSTQGEVRCLLSGGAAEMVAEALTRRALGSLERFENLVLYGLHAVARTRGLT
jgi:type III pantothenate kinase